MRMRECSAVKAQFYRCTFELELLKVIFSTSAEDFKGKSSIPGTRLLIIDVDNTC